LTGGQKFRELIATCLERKARISTKEAEEKELSDEQHDYDNHRRTHLAMYDEYHSWDIVDIANFAHDHPQPRHIKPTTLAGNGV
jgi:hypothetical protein